MDKNEIKTLLHQREPYLMVSEVVEIDKTHIEVIKNHEGNEAHLGGHFPGAPIVPGAMLQEICTQAAGILITKHHSPVKNYHSETTKGWALGVLKKVSFAKFSEMVKPDKPILAKVELVDKEGSLFKFQAKVLQGKAIRARFQFQLANISDKYLTS